MLDVSGEAALGGTADHQDFLMINQDRAPLTNSREFIDFMEAATPGPCPASCISSRRMDWAAAGAA